MKRKFFIVLVSVVVLAVGVVALFLNSNYYYSKKLVSAIRDKDMVAVRQIIEKNPTCINTYPALTSKWWHSAMNWRVCYPLNEACATGNIDLIELLIDNGADVNCNDGLTPLAISHCDTDLAELLLRYGGTLSHIYRSLSYALHNHVRKSNPNLTRDQIYSKMQRSTKINRVASKTAGWGIDIVRSILPY